MNNDLPMKELLITKFSLYNKYVAKELWPLAAIMLWELVSEYDYYKNEGKLREDGSFYSSINNVREATWLKRKNQDSAIAILEKAGILIKSFNKSEWNKRFFKLNPDKIMEYTKYGVNTEDNATLCPTGTDPLPWEDIPPFVLPGQTLCPERTDPLSWEDIALSHEYNHKQIINNRIKNNNKNNNIGAQKKNSNAGALPASDVVVDSKLDKGSAKKQRKTKKQQRYDEVVSSVEFNTLLHEGLTEEKDIVEIDTLWSEFVDLRCSKDYRALTDWAVKRNLNVLAWTTFAEKKAILEKAVKKWWTGLYPLSNYDKQQTQEALASVEWSDERLYKKIFDTNCKEKEDEVSNWTTHNLLMQLCETYWEDKIKQIYYDRVKPKIVEIYWIKRDWK